MKRKLLIIAISVALGTTSFLVAAMYQQAVTYVTELIIFEQRDHYIQMHMHVDRLHSVMKRAEKDVARITSREPLTTDERDVISMDLRELEDVSAQIARRKIYYDEDNTVHMFFAPEPAVVTLFTQTYNTPLYIDRFVRVMEQGIFVSQISVGQKELIQKTFEVLQQEVNAL